MFTHALGAKPFPPFPLTHPPTGPTHPHRNVAELEVGGCMFARNTATGMGGAALLMNVQKALVHGVSP